MLPSAALILTDDLRARFDGVDLAEHAARVAQQAGINHLFFAGRHAPDLSVLRRLRARGVFGNTLLGWPRLFADAPAARVTLVLDARTVIEPQVLRALLRDALATPERASLIVDVGPQRKNSLIRVADGAVMSVMGDGNASNVGIAVIPDTLLGRLRGVCSMQDAIHRLAKTGDLGAIAIGTTFWRTIRTIEELPEIEREYRRHRAHTFWGELIGRFVKRTAMLPRLAARAATSIAM